MYTLKITRGKQVWIISGEEISYGSGILKQEFPEDNTLPNGMYYINYGVNTKENIFIDRIFIPLDEIEVDMAIFYIFVFKEGKTETFILPALHEAIYITENGKTIERID